VDVLRALLMKHGVGRWAQIQASGLLPGKSASRLRQQTQRLLGQQSLGPFRGLRVDLARVRADNDARTGAPRRAGLIIGDDGRPPAGGGGGGGECPAPADVVAAQRRRYGLSAEALRAVDAELERLARGPPAEPSEAELLAADPDRLTRAATLALVRGLSAAIARREGRGRGGGVGARGDGASAGRREGGAGGGGAGAGPGGGQRRGRKRRRGGEGEEAALSADLGELRAMGFSTGEAQDALVACGPGNLEGALEWLLSRGRGPRP